MLFEALTEFDSRFWRTLRKLVVNPGAVALRYIQGSRADFINPIRFFSRPSPSILRFQH